MSSEMLNVFIMRHILSSLGQTINCLLGTVLLIGWFSSEAHLVSVFVLFYRERLLKLSRNQFDFTTFNK